MNKDTQEAQFAEWLRDHRGIVVKVARSFATGRDVDDLVQEILLRLWQSAKTFRGDAAPSTWVYRIAINRALTWRRDQASSTGRTQSIAEIADVPALEANPISERLEQVYAAIRTLPEIDRTLLLLSLDGFSYADMADITGMTSTNVGARLSRARTRLSTELQVQP